MTNLARARFVIFFCILLFGGRGLSGICCIFAAEIIKNTFYDDFRQL